MKTAPNMLYYRSRYLFSVQLKTILSKPGFKKLVKHHNLVNVKTYLQLLKAFRIKYTECFFYFPQFFKQDDSRILKEIKVISFRNNKEKE